LRKLGNVDRGGKIDTLSGIKAEKILDHFRNLEDSVFSFGERNSLVDHINSLDTVEKREISLPAGSRTPAVQPIAHLCNE
jgi:hypothetical protein